jgi:4-hydroxy-2-oxoheptanedioate aldolase
MNTLTAKWKDGATTLGAWLSLTDPHLAEIAATSGYDYVCVDMQHGRSELRDVMALLHAMARTPAVPIVRVPWNEPGIIGRVLDAGAMGVVIPMVNTPDEARRAVAACRYAPDGMRSFGPLVTAARHGADYLSLANAGVACIPMIETREAVEHVEDIVAVGGIDAIYIGPADLSLTYGLPPRVDQSGEPFDSALTRVVEACKAHGVVPGIHANAAVAAARHKVGFRMMSVGFDALPASVALRRDVVTARESLG